MVLTRNDYFKFVKDGKIESFCEKIDALDEQAIALVSELVAATKKIMIDIFSTTNCDELVLGHDNDPRYALLYKDGEVFVRIESDKDTLYNVDEMGTLRDAILLFSVLGWLD